MGIPSWLEDPDVWDEIYVGDAYFNETKVDVEGTPFGNDFDIQKPKGSDGAKVINRGYKPWQPKLSVVIYSEFHWEQYQIALQLYQPKPGKVAPSILRLVHPIFDLYKKDRFKIEFIHPLKSLGMGQWVAVFDLVEHFDEPKAIPKAKPNADQQPPGSRRERLGLEYELNKPSAKPKP